MTIIGLISILHQPIYRLKDTIEMLSKIGTSNEQILEIVSIQFSLLSFLLALVGYVFGWLTIIFWPSFQQLPIAGMIIRPETGNIIIPIVLCLGFGSIALIFTYRYAKREFFSFEN